VYTNILLAYGAAASSDETVRVVTEEIEEILRDDPGYFGATADKSADIAAGKAGHDILASAYGSAACGRAVLGDGEASARWLREAREHRWKDLALCSNLVCFQNMRADPYLKPLVAEIAEAEVARLEAGLKGKKSKDTNALFTVALTLHNGGHLDAAERYYRRVLAQSPKHPDALNNLGNIHGTRGNYAAAIESYDAALAVVPEHPLFHACRAWALARAERYAEAVEASTRSIELDPNQASGYFPRGAAWLGLGDRGKAAEDFRCGVALNPGWRASEKDDPWFGDLVAIIEAG